MITFVKEDNLIQGESTPTTSDTPEFRAGTSSILSGIELFRLTCSELGLVSGSDIIWLELLELLKFCNLFSSPVELAKKLTVLTEIWARVVSGLFTTSFSSCLRAGSGTRCSCTLDDPDHWVAGGCLLTIVPRTIAHLIPRPGNPSDS